MNSSPTPDYYREREQELTQELFAYYELAASCISDPAQLKELLDDLCSSEEYLLTNRQVELERRQAPFVRNLLKEAGRMEALREVCDAAMDQACAVGGAYYRETATKLTELEAEAYQALEAQKYETFSQVLTKIKGFGIRRSVRAKVPVGLDHGSVLSNQVVFVGRPL
jgi:hypothetical protein